MAIPDFQTVMRPVLAAVADGTPVALSELREKVAQGFQLTEAELHERLPSGKQTVINNRIGWARTYLNKAGLLHIPAKGMVQITERGWKRFGLDLSALRLAGLSVTQSLPAFIPHARPRAVSARHPRTCRKIPLRMRG